MKIVLVKKGKYVIKIKNLVKARIFYRPDFFEGLDVPYNNDWNIEMFGMSKEFDTMKECIDSFNEYNEMYKII